MLALVGHAKAVAETLPEALAAAYNNNPAIEAERARQRATEELVPQAKAAGRPTVAVDGLLGKQRLERTPPGLAEHLDPRGLGIRLTQPLFQGFRTLHGKRRAEADVRAGKALLRDREQSILLAAVASYAAVRRARQVEKLHRDNVAFLRRELDSAHRRFNGGALTRTDVAQTHSRLERGLADLAQAGADRQSSEAEYISVIGRAPGPLAPPPPLAGLLPRDLAEAEQAADAANPLVNAAEFLEESAHYQTRFARGQHLPTLSLDAHYARAVDSDFGLDREDSSGVQLRLSMPLYQGGRVSSEVREARENEARRRYEVTDTRNRIRAAVNRAWPQRQAALQRSAAAERQVAAARQALAGVSAEARVGKRSFTDVLDAQREFLEARVALARAHHDATVTGFTVLATIGRLIPEEAAPQVEPAATAIDIQPPASRVRSFLRARRAEKAAPASPPANPWLATVSQEPAAADDPAMTASRDAAHRPD